MLKRETHLRYTLVSALVLLIGTASIGGAQCWECFLDAPLPIGNYHCVRTGPGPTASVSCNDFGGTSYPCAMGAPCEQTLSAAVATVRPDGVMSLAVGLSQLMRSDSWLQTQKSLGDALLELFPSLTRSDGRGETISHVSASFGDVFAALANSGVTASTACEGHRVARSYTKDQARFLRQATAVFTI